jgi:hypothetical protein
VSRSWFGALALNCRTRCSCTTAWAPGTGLASGVHGPSSSQRAQPIDPVAAEGNALPGEFVGDAPVVQLGVGVVHVYQSVDYVRVIPIPLADGPVSPLDVGLLDRFEYPTGQRDRDALVGRVRNERADHCGGCRRRSRRSPGAAPRFLFHKAVTLLRLLQPLSTVAASTGDAWLPGRPLTTARTPSPSSDQRSAASEPGTTSRSRSRAICAVTRHSRPRRRRHRGGGLCRKRLGHGSDPASKNAALTDPESTNEGQVPLLTLQGPCGTPTWTRLLHLAALPRRVPWLPSAGTAQTPHRKTRAPA